MFRASPIDAAFLAVESYRTPMHVGCVQIFSAPKDSDSEYLRELVRELKASSNVVPPFSLKLMPSMLKTVLPSWVEDTDMDIHHHLQHWALPHPGGQRELDMLVSRLHSHELDMERPPWECHFIEGLAGGRFALFTKIHHALVDGIGGVRLLQSMLTTDPTLQHMAAPWEQPKTAKTSKKARSQEHYHEGILRLLWKQGRAQIRGLPGLYGAFAGIAKAALSRRWSNLSTPFSAPQMSFNRRISTERRFSTLNLPLSRIRQIAKATSVSVNDVCLELCASGLRRYLLDRRDPLDKPLVAGLPMSLRPQGNTDLGTQVTFILASLATDMEDPYERLQAIHASTTAAKHNVHQLEPGAFTEYTLLLMLPYILELLLGLSGRGRPIFNIVISNVPGPTETLYFNGAKLEAMYPLSIITHGQGINITVLSYQDQLNFGLTACNKIAPHIQCLSQYIAEGLTELEAYFELATSAAHE